MMSLSILLSVPVLGYVALLGYFYLFQESVVFFPRPDRGSSPLEWGIPAREFKVDSGGNSLQGWYFPAGEGAMVVHFSHGNASTIGMLRDYTLLFHGMGMGVMVYDYRGYGQSQGKPDEAGVYEDGEATWRYLTTELGVDPRRVIFFGHSLGGGVACYLAEKFPSLALVVEGSFTSLPELGQQVYPFLPRWVGRIHFNNRSRLARLQTPVMIIHARGDEVVPLSHGEALFAAARPPKQWLEVEGGHDRGFVQAGTQAHETFRQFIQTVSQSGK
ncbi:MAG: alpha/beta hydrolase [Magnetococcales bacterium]|nr:alpha/beta hydrolase [Magnetococcales bacterium]NGZ26174.1 alpha/beta hydrolase [Magnetococcales bacterium]